jgi:hypothetical protein
LQEKPGKNEPTMISDAKTTYRIVDEMAPTSAGIDE